MVAFGKLSLNTFPARHQGCAPDDSILAGRADASHCGFVRYERGATLLTTNRIYKQWASIFNGDATLTSALLDRLLDHVETILIEGKSYRGQTHDEA